MRWIAGVVALVVLAGIVAAGILVFDDDDRPGAAVVSAAGGQSGTVDVTSTVTMPLPTTPAPPSTVAPTTTLPIAGSTTTTRRPATTTTTRPPAPTTTVPVATTAAPTTTTIPRFTATLVNEYPQAVVLILNGQQIPLALGQTLDIELPRSGRGDLVQVRLPGDAECGSSDSGEIFRANTRYRVAIVAGEAKCSGSDLTRPRLDIDRL
jgi:hypothetical protein